ncbi:hypothetical protein COO60DRAFT_801456 [Scenedesmus sp. NREL 46B-D3]|nr:hypothetical protein COO60DRAFT_801456 [Scenedesmus sp. NREL 46B-D3]
MRVYACLQQGNVHADRHCCAASSAHVQTEIPSLRPRLTRPRSPNTTPRLTTAAADPALVRNLRLFLLHAAQKPGWSSELEDLLTNKLELQPGSKQHALQVICEAQQAVMTPAQLVELETGLHGMLRLFSTHELLRLLQGHPQLLQCPLASWLEFFNSFGFNTSQIKNLVSQQPRVLIDSDVAKAGAAILQLKQLGFDNDEVRHRVVAFCPQVLAMSEQDINMLIRLWSKFGVGVDERAGM